MNATALSSAQLSSSSSSWVSGNVWLWTCVLTPHTLAAIRRHGEIETLASREPNYWINLQGDEDSPRCVAEQTVREVHERVMRGFIRERGLDACIKGIEYWAQVYKPGAGLAFHFDKDEAVMCDEGRLEHPIFSSVLYLHDDADDADENAERIRRFGMLTESRLGATIVMNQRSSDDMNASVTQGVLCYPRANALLVFDGALAHGVLESVKKGRRKTLLMNWWSRSPRNVAPIDVGAMEGMSPAATTTSSSAVTSSTRDGGCADAPRRMDIASIDVRVDVATALEDVLPSSGRIDDAIGVTHRGAQMLHLEEPSGAVVFVPDSP